MAVIAESPTFFLPLVTYPDPSAEMPLARALDLAATMGGAVRALVHEVDVPPELDALCARGLAQKDVNDELRLTPAGLAMRDRVVAARRNGLADMLARWQPEQHPDVLALIERMAQALTSDLPAPKAA